MTTLFIDSMYQLVHDVLSTLLHILCARLAMTRMTDPVFLVQVAQVLSDPLRLQILDLVWAGRFSRCSSPQNPDAPTAICSRDLLERIEGLSISRLSYHLTELRKAGLIDEHPRGKWIYLSPNHATLAALLSVLTDRYIAHDTDEHARVVGA